MQRRVGFPVHTGKVGASAVMRGNADRDAEQRACKRHPLLSQSRKNVAGDFFCAVAIAIRREDQKFIAEPSALIAFAARTWICGDLGHNCASRSAAIAPRES